MMAALWGFCPGDRVRYVGVTGRADGLSGRVVRCHRSGVRVRWDDGSIYTIHPEDITAL